MSRRELVQLLAGATAVACTPRGDGPPAPRPDPPWPDGPAPEVVLTIEGVTWYADGLVLLRRAPDVMLYGSEEMQRSPELLLLRADAAEIARLRALVGDAEVQGAAPVYLQPGVHDGTHLFIVAGARRIHVGNDPPGLPAALAQLKEAYHAIHRRADADAVDAFICREPRLVALHTRSFRARGFADELAVFADGVLDYRVTLSDAPRPASGDWPDPTLRIEQVPRPTLAPLLEALAALDRGDVPSHPPKLGDDVARGTAHMLAHGGRVPRIRTRAGQGVPEPLQPVLAALADLRARFDAPPDEA